VIPMTGNIKNKVKKRVEGEARKKLQADKAEINDKGQEVLDSQPLFHKVGFKEPPSMNERIRAAVLQAQAETVAQLQAQNLTPEQAQALLDEENDFNIDDEVNEVFTQYEAAGLVSELQEEGLIEVQNSVESSAAVTEEAPSEEVSGSSSSSAEQTEAVE
jgi:hypothetical protein